MLEGIHTWFYAIYDREDPVWFYVGSTWNWRKRKSKHKNNSDEDENLKYTYFDEVGRDRMEFVILEEREVQDKKEKLFIEQWFIDDLMPSLNVNRAYISAEVIKERGKIYREKYKEVIKEQNRIYREKYKEVIRERKKIYREKNKEVIRERKKIYREKNKEVIKKQMSQKVICDCGIQHTHGHRARHYKTIKHQNWLKSIS
jgi:hypothetical protein